MHRKHSFLPGEIYHIYNRGNDKRQIFMDNSDYLRFVALLYLANGTEPINMRNRFYQGLALVEQIFEEERGDQLVDIGAWVLMPNHFHIMLRERVDGGLERFMQKLSTGYSMYFNKKNERTGALFEGRFKSRHVGDEGYMQWLFAYIHLNPLKLFDPHWKQGISNIAQARTFMEGFTWGSYQDWFGKERAEGKILSPGVFPEEFKKLNTFEDILKEFSKESFNHSLDSVTLTK
jgi:putative transposase